MRNFLAFFRKHKKIILALLVVVVVGAILFIQNQNRIPDWVTSTVDEGTVSQIISVSGTMDATQTAELAFPIPGTIESLAVKEGDVVIVGSPLATLAHNDLKAEYQDAYGALLIARADLEELVTGIRPEERDIARTKVAIAKEELARITKEQNDRVENAYRALLSTDLEARPKNKDSEDLPPTVSGTYKCAEGTYAIHVFRSSAQSGYSYRLSGLEGGTYTAYTETPSPLGTCGLSIQFITGESYGDSEWSIQIPNTESTSYVTNLNVYTLARTERENAIRAAEQNLELAKQTEVLDIADPRAESLTREEARVLQAEARLARVSADIQDHVLVAPFEGTITHVDPVPGEAVGTTPIITMISRDIFHLTALIPEIDITKITLGQKARVEFDARAGEILTASIIFISPLAREIEGVSYFEATLMLDTPPEWLRSGLNADIDIIMETRENVLRIPKRFLVGTESNYSVLVPNGETTREVPVTVEFTGNDGYVEVSGLTRGDTVVAP
jgi:multidrug efflux pump subunit AcrA (membrane-fusion protein)